MKALLCQLILSCTPPAIEAKPVDELSYGTVLYGYFQEDYQDAMLSALVAEAQDRRGEDTVRFDLALGSFAFNDGMYAYAADVFARVDPSELNDLDKMRLSFHLAREYHRRGDWTGLEAELARIDLGKNWRGKLKHHPEVEYMRAELAVHKGDFTTARSHLDLLPKREPLRAYGLYNLGVALRESDAARSLDVFSELADMPAYSDEAFDLIQRAKLAQAFLAREQTERADAAKVLENLPGSGRYRDTALAAYGGLAMDNGDYELAARVWLTLQQQDYWTPSTAAARLGYPLTLEQLASRELALQQYRAAEASFASRLTSLDSLAQRAQDPEWIRGLLQTFSTPDTDPERMGELMRGWQEELGHTSWLEWLSTEAVHDVLMQWRTLTQEQRWLSALPERLAAYEEVAVERKRRSRVAHERLYDDELLATREALLEQTNTGADRLAQLRAAPAEPSSEWMLALATDDERELINELDGMRAKIESHFAGSLPRDWQPWLQRIERLRGLTFWSIAHDQAARLRALEKQLHANQALLADVDAKVRGVELAEQRFTAGVATDFAAFSSRARELTARVDAAVQGREEMLAQQIRNGMEIERRHVEQYLLVTRVAIARASDQLAAVTDMDSGQVQP